MIDPDFELRILRVMEVLEPGWNFSIGVDQYGQEMFVLCMPCADSEWAMSECTFDEAIDNTIEIMEAFQWN